MNHRVTVAHPTWKIQVVCTHDIQFPTNGDACHKNITVFERHLLYNNLKLSGGKEARVFFVPCPNCGKIVIVPPERITDDVQLYVMTIASLLRENIGARLTSLRQELEELTRKMADINAEIALVKSQCRHERIDPDERAPSVCLDCGKHLI